MLIKKDEEPFFYKFLSIAKEIIRKNKRYTPVFYGDEEKLYLVWKTRMTVDKFMKILKEGSYINYKTSNKDTTIYVPNYSKYQD